MRRVGFTLIELMVVMVIIGILASLLLPVISMVRGSAIKAQCSSRQRQLAQACIGYSADWEGWFPPAVDTIHMRIAMRCNGAEVPHGLGFTTEYFQMQGQKGSSKYHRLRSSMLYCPPYEDQFPSDKAGYRYNGNLRKNTKGMSHGDPRQLASPLSGGPVRNGCAYGVDYFSRDKVGGSDVVLIFELIAEHKNPPHWGGMLFQSHPPDNALRPAGPVPLVEGGNVTFADGHVQWIDNQHWVRDGGPGGWVYYRPNGGW